MAEQKQNRKALRTQRLIRKILAELLESKEFKDITVQEIADKADISRTTFYNYYKNVYDIYKQTEQVVLDDMGKIVQMLGMADEKDMFGAIFLYIEANPEIFKMIFSPNTTDQIREKIGELFEKMCIEIWLERAGKSELTEIQSLLIHHHVQGSIAIVARWVRNDYKEPKELIVKAMSIADQAAEEFIMK